VAKQFHKPTKKGRSNGSQVSAPSGLRQSLVRQQIGEFKNQISELGDDLCQMQTLSEALNPVLQLSSRLNKLTVLLKGHPDLELCEVDEPAFGRLRSILNASADPQLADLVRQDLTSLRAKLDQQLGPQIDRLKDLTKGAHSKLEKLALADLTNDPQIESLQLSLQNLANSNCDVTDFVANPVNPCILDILAIKLEQMSEQLKSQLAEEEAETHRQQLLARNPVLQNIVELTERHPDLELFELEFRKVVVDLNAQRVRDSLPALRKALSEASPEYVAEIQQIASSSLDRYGEIGALAESAFGGANVDDELRKNSWDDVAARLELISSYKIDPKCGRIFAAMPDLVTRPEPEMREYLALLGDYAQRLPRAIAPRVMLPEQYPENFLSRDQLSVANEKLEVLEQRKVGAELLRWEQIVEESRSENERLLVVAGVNQQQASIFSHLLFRVIYNWGDFAAYYHRRDLCERAVSSGIISDLEIKVLDAVIEKFERAGFFKPRSVDPDLLQFDPSGRSSSSQSLQRAFKTMNRLHAIRAQLTKSDAQAKDLEIVVKGDTPATFPRMTTFFAFRDLVHSITELDRLKVQLKDYCDVMPVVFGSSSAPKDSQQYASAVEIIAQSYQDGFLLNNYFVDFGHTWRSGVGLFYCDRVTRIFQEGALKLDRVLSELEEQEPQLIEQLHDLREHFLKPLLQVLAPIAEKARTSEVRWSDTERGFSDYFKRNIWPAAIEATREMLAYFEANRDELLEQLAKQQAQLQELLEIRFYA